MREPNFEGLTPETKRALFVARHRAFLDGSAEIEGRHVLGAFLAERDASILELLARLDVDPERVRGSLPPIPAQPANPSTREIPLSPLLKRALEAADSESDRAGREAVETTHVLIGLLGVEGCLPPDVLAGHRFTLEYLRGAIGRG